MYILLLKGFYLSMESLKSVKNRHRNICFGYLYGYLWMRLHCYENQIITQSKHIHYVAENTFTKEISFI